MRAEDESMAYERCIVDGSVADHPYSSGRMIGACLEKAAQLHYNTRSNGMVMCCIRQQPAVAAVH